MLITLLFITKVLSTSVCVESTNPSPYTRSCTNWILPSIPAGQSRCVVNKVFSGSSSKTSGVVKYSGLKGTACSIFGCDSYTVDYGTVSAAGTDEDCDSFDARFTQAWTAAEAASGPNWIFENSILAGQKPAIRITCDNSAFTCDFEPATFYAEWDARASPTSSSSATASSSAPTDSSSSSAPTDSSSSSATASSSSPTGSPSSDQTAPLVISMSTGPYAFQGDTQEIKSDVVMEDEGGSHLKSVSYLKSLVTADCTIATYDQCVKTTVQTINAPPNTDGPWTVTLRHTLTNVAPGAAYLFAIRILDGANNVGLVPPPVIVRRTGTGSGTTTTTPTTPECFLVGTRITYKGREYMMEQLEKMSECVIPHVVESDGICITANGHPHKLCLTKDHLVRTPEGFVMTKNLRKGDVIFLKDDKTTTISRLEPITNKKFFGLNCLQSTVLADGIQTSTFGNLHYIPSAWMAIVGRFTGVQKASAIGDSIAKWFHGVY